MLKIITTILLTLLSIAYPLLWLWQPEAQALNYFPIVLALLWAVKAYQAVNFQRFFALLVTVLLLFAAISREWQLMYWYPVAVNGLMLLLFGGSLWTEQSMIERFARLQEPNLPTQAICYTRRVTQVWCGLFSLNIIITTGLIILEYWTGWALYSGVIAYLLMGILLVGEWCIRPNKKKGKNE